MQLSSSKSNDILLLLLGFLYTFAILFSRYLINDLILMFFIMLNVQFLAKIQYKNLFKFILLVIPMVIMSMISALIFAKNTHNTVLVWHFYYIKIHQEQLNTAIFMAVRSLTLALSAVVVWISLDMEYVILFFLQRKIIPVEIGYGILASLNAITFVKQEFIRINLAYKMRFITKKSWLATIYPLLINTARYATQCGLSLELRNLKNDKIYIVETQSWQLKDTIIVIFNLSLILYILYL